MSDLLLLEHLLYVNDLEAQGHSSIVKYWLAPKAQSCLCQSNQNKMHARGISCMPRLAP